MIEPQSPTPHAASPLPQTPAELERALEAAGYLPDAACAVSAWLALRLERPLMVEGPAGVGKTDLARALAAALGRPLVRLQCYEGLDESRAIHEWDYAKQMLYTQLLRDRVSKEVEGATSLADAVERVGTGADALFGEAFLVERPLLRAIRATQPVVLLVDEVDRADPEFEAVLLETLAEMQITIPELGTIRATHPPLVVLTTNATRDMTDALRRRCLHATLDYPSPSRELRILELKVPGISRALAEQLTTFVQKVRELELRKAPSVAETLDWARALLLLGASALDSELARSALGALLKHEEDREKVAPLLGRP